MAGVSKGQFSNDDFMCIRACRDDGELRRRLEKKGRGFAFNSPNTKKKTLDQKKIFFKTSKKRKNSIVIFLIGRKTMMIKMMMSSAQLGRNRSS